MTIMGIIVGYCETANPDEHVVVRGGTYSVDGKALSAYGIHVNGELKEVIPSNAADALRDCYVYARKIAINYKNCARVEQITVGNNFFKVTSRVEGVDRDWWPNYLENAEDCYL